MKIFSAEYLDELVECACKNERKRLHRNIHLSYHEPCQRLFNAIEPNSYIRPHKHDGDPRDELLIAVRGLMALVTFDEQGSVLDVLCFGSERYGKQIAVGAEVPANTWHTVVALERGCILLEIKAGPFNSSHPKNLAPWAPEEGSKFVQQYFLNLITSVNALISES